MKSLHLIIALLLIALPASAQKEIKNQKWGYGLTFLDEGDSMPDALHYLPAPPEFGTEEFTNDSIIYEKGKRLRLTARGDTAVMDANTSIAYYLKRFSPAVGKELTEKNCPVLTKTLKGLMQDVRGGIQHAKNTFARHRPYQHFKEATPIPEDEDLRTTHPIRQATPCAHGRQRCSSPPSIPSMERKSCVWAMSLVQAAQS